MTRRAVVTATSLVLAVCAACGTGHAGTLSSPAGQARRPMTAYVFGGDRMTPVNIVTGKVGKAIKVGAACGIAITPDGRKVYLASAPGGTVTVIRAAANQPEKVIKIRTRGPGSIADICAGLAVTPDGRTVYVLIGSSVVPIDTATDTAGKPIRVVSARQAADNAGAWDMAITPDSKTAYAMNTLATMIPIDTATGTAGKPVHLGPPGQYGPSIVITPDGHTAYVITGHGVVPVDTATNTPGPAIKAGPNPAQLAITPDGRTVYALGGMGPDIITPINTATNQAGKPIEVRDGPELIVITPDGKTAYVTTASGTVVPISTATNKPGKAIKIGQCPMAIAVAPDSTRVLVGDGHDIAVIQTATNTIIKKINIGHGICHIAVTP